MEKKILLVFAILLINFVSAISINDSVTKDAIIPELNHPAEVDLIVSNLNSGDYNVYTLTDVKMIPTDSFKLDSPNDNVKLLIYPTSELNVTGYYSFTYYLREDRTNTNNEDKMLVNIMPLKSALEITSEANDMNKDTVRFFVRNRANADLKNLNVNFSSALFKLENQKFDLDAYSTKIFDVAVPNLKTVQAGSYLVNGNVEVISGSGNIEGKVYIGEKKGIDTTDEKKGLIIRTQTITKTNVGNVPEEVNVVIERDAFSRLFTTFNVEPNVVDRDGWKVSYIWSEKLGPAEKFELVAKTNFVFPVLVLIVALFLVFGFQKFYTQKVEVVKSVSPVRTKGGQFALRVRVTVKAKDNVQNVSLVDKIPAVVKVHENFGVAEPNKVDLKNRRIEWNFGNMNSGETRTVSYIVYSTVGVVGRFALPSSVVVFEQNNEIHEVESNQVYFLSEQTLE